VDRLSVRLALATGGSVAVVIVVVSIIVNATIGARLNDYLAAERLVRRDEVAALIVQHYQDTGSLQFTPAGLRQLASLAGGQIAIFDAGGTLVARMPRVAVPAGPNRPTSTAPLSDGTATIGRLEVTPTQLAAGMRQTLTDAFRKGIDQTLLLAGIGAIVVSAVVALLMSLQLTRPLTAVAAAAHRLGSGDLAVRAPVPGDREGRELALAFNTMADGLQRSEALRRRAASDLAHEIATPVQVLETQLDAMADGVVPASPERLAAAREAAGEVGALVGDLHELGAAEGAALQRSPERVDLNLLAGSVASAGAALYQQRRIRLEVGTAEPDSALPCWAIVDPRQVERALRNLLTNAAIYTPSGGTVRLSVAREAGWARIRVTDTGPGIPAEHQALIFERFYRADPARPRTPGVPGGTGIGLTVSRELARANGGDVRIESTGPTGTTFVLEVPAAM